MAKSKGLPAFGTFKFCKAAKKLLETQEFDPEDVLNRVVEDYAYSPEVKEALKQRMRVEFGLPLKEGVPVPTSLG